MFGISGSKQSSSSTSQSQSTASSFDFGLSGSESLSLSEGASQSTGFGRTTQSLAFEDLFRSLFTGASGAAAKVAEAAPIFQGEAAQLFRGGLRFLDTLQEEDAATGYLESRLTGPDQAAEAQLGALGSELGDFFNEQLLPGITSRGVAGGTFGGSRTGVAVDRAAKGVASTFSRGAADILSRSQAGRDAAASTLGGLRTQRAATGLSALPSLLAIPGASMNAALSPYTALASILGGPTVLSESVSGQQATSYDLARALSESFGIQVGGSESQSTSSSTSTSKGKSFGLSVGPFGSAKS